MKVVIVGGVAGGAGCAARLRRLDETAEIVRTTSAMSSAPVTPCSSLRRSR